MFDRPYPIDFKREFLKVSRQEYGPLDENGIPLVDYQKLYSSNGIRSKGKRFPTVYTPVTIAQYALHLWKLVIQGDHNAKEKFITQSDWLVNNLEETKNKFRGWIHYFPVPMYRLEPGWLSAMAQGEGISVLIRAYHLTQNEKYLNCALRAFSAFKHNIAEGGVSYFDTDGKLWLEEYPHFPPLNVLNGMIFAILGLHDLMLATQDKEVATFFQSSVETLLQHISDYDCGYGSVYDLYFRQVVDQKYHNLHIQQLFVLYEITGQQKFKEIAARWQQYGQSNWKCWQRRWRPKLTHRYWNLKLRQWQIL
jgi:heparosan-N-sulfate-glucuronate 5-epimerase